MGDYQRTYQKGHTSFVPCERGMSSKAILEIMQQRQKW